MGTQYRSAIFTHSEAQLKAAKASKAAEEARIGKSIGTPPVHCRVSPKAVLSCFVLGCMLVCVCVCVLWSIWQWGILTRWCCGSLLGGMSSNPTPAVPNFNSQPPATEITPAPEFYEAEEYHQEYLKKVRMPTTLPLCGCHPPPPPHPRTRDTI